ncbi:MAG: restriction endonuclease subunit S [Mangrovibacterium sp.]
MTATTQAANRFISFSTFQKLSFWDYYTLSNKAIVLSTYSLVELGTVIKQRKENIVIDDSKTYKRCRVQLYGNGVVLRDEIEGKLIKTKKQQFCKPNDFLVAEIDAKFGGYGIVPDYLGGAIVSSHYFLFEIDTKQLLPDFLGLVVKCNDFSKQVKATGSTNYAAIRPYHVLSYLIPLPSLAEQRQLVDDYNNRIKEAERLEAEAKQLEEKIEEYLLKRMGLMKSDARVNLTGLQLLNFARLERWDMLAMDLKILNILSASKFKLKSIGEIYSFPKRSWKKESAKEQTFRYIELGDVDPSIGIIEAKEVTVIKAPSRATQKIKKGDLLIGTTRPYLKRFAIVPEEYDSCICSSGFSIIEQRDGYDLRFLKEFLMSHFGIEQLKNKMTGALYPAITESEFKQILIPLPEVTIQRQIADEIEFMRKTAIEKNETSEKQRQQAITEFESKIFMPCN